MEILHFASSNSLQARRYFMRNSGWDGESQSQEGHRGGVNLGNMEEPEQP